MILTIGMPSYNNYSEVWFTVQALRLYHNLEDCEILVVDNYGDPALETFCVHSGAGQVRYIKETSRRGTAPAKQVVFENACGDFVLCIDSHVLLSEGAISNLKEFIDFNPQSSDLFQGPLRYDYLYDYVDRFEDIWRGNMWGIWGAARKELPKDPYEIWANGMGLFGCYKDKWLGFNPRFRGFGGEEGYIHEKYRRAGHKVICLPWLTWVHKFHNQSSPTSYPNILEDRVRNYIIGFTELGMDLEPIKTHFGEDLFNRAKLRFENETGNLEAPL